MNFQELKTEITNFRLLINPVKSKVRLKKRMFIKWLILTVIDPIKQQVEAEELVKALKDQEWILSKPESLNSIEDANNKARCLRKIVRKCAGISLAEDKADLIGTAQKEFSFLRRQSFLLEPYFKALRARRLLYVGQSYYNCYYLSRGMREEGWKADLLDWDANPEAAIYYHGQDFSFTVETPYDIKRDLYFYLEALYRYDVFHFSNKHGIRFGNPSWDWFSEHFGDNSEIYLLRALGKITSYSNNSCNDGVLQSSFAKWGPESVCSICIWKNNPDVCSDKINRDWGEFRNKVIDYQCITGGNRIDYNLAPTVHEAPQFYCLDEKVWDPTLPIPEQFKLPVLVKGTVRLYHAVGNKNTRTNEDGINIKSSHVHLPLVKKLREEGVPVELISPHGISNKDVRYYQMQADIFLEMLTFGWFGANVREAMMLAKPVICYIRPEWMDSLRSEMPDYANELPIISATPDTVEAVLRDLIGNPEKRHRIGVKSREFAIKWHSSKYAAQRFDEIYISLLQGDPLLLESSSKMMNTQINNLSRNN